MRGVYPVIVGLFEPVFVGRVLNVVLVRGIAGPVSFGREHLDHDQPVRGELRRHDMRHGAGGGALPSRLDSHVARGDQRGRVAALGGSRSPTQLHRPEGFNDEAGARWQIGAPGKPGEGAWALAYLPVEFPDPELDLAAQEHERGLLVAGVPRPTYTVRGMSYGEAQVFPPGRRGRDFNEHARLVVGRLVGFDKQLWHILLDHHSTQCHAAVVQLICWTYH